MRDFENPPDVQFEDLTYEDLMALRREIKDLMYQLPVDADEVFRDLPDPVFWWLFA